MTLELAFGAMLFAILIGIPFGIISAYKHQTVVDAGDDGDSQPGRFNADLLAGPLCLQVSLG